MEARKNPWPHVNITTRWFTNSVQVLTICLFVSSETNTHIHTHTHTHTHTDRPDHQVWDSSSADERTWRPRSGVVNFLPSENESRRHHSHQLWVPDGCLTERINTAASSLPPGEPFINTQPLQHRLHSHIYSWMFPHASLSSPHETFMFMERKM